MNRAKIKASVAARSHTRYYAGAANSASPCAAVGRTGDAAGSR